jgi:hypothetical protein
MQKLNELGTWFANKNFVSVRSGVLYVTVWMTWLAFDWAALFATTTEKTGAEVALIIAAVTAPISLLQGAVFKVYSDSRSD